VVQNKLKKDEKEGFLRMLFESGWKKNFGEQSLQKRNCGKEEVRQ